jgi:2-polyprenyl-3-methyl-5-hydroxy-6-metoxy-1,4-benzoquinol methylase
MMTAQRGSGHTSIQAATLPEFELFARSCREGLSVLYPFISRSLADPAGWKFGACSPPSHYAFGRMRSLLAAREALRLKPRRVLEVAAGGGGLASYLAACGCEVTANDLRGDELAVGMREYATGSHVEVVGGNLFDLTPDRIGTFDLVVACEVIEHVAYPGELLKHLRKFLSPGGRILLTTPNGAYFRNKLPTYSQVQDFTELEAKQFKPDADGHLFLLTVEELQDLAAAASLSIERLKVWGTPLLTGQAGVRHFSRMLGLRAAYQAEQLCHYLPSAGRERVCVAVSAVVKAL